jgi:hypothetical protein
MLKEVQERAKTVKTILKEKIFPTGMDNIRSPFFCCVHLIYPLLSQCLSLSLNLPAHCLYSGSIDMLLLGHSSTKKRKINHAQNQIKKIYVLLEGKQV